MAGASDSAASDSAASDSAARLTSSGPRESDGDSHSSVESSPRGQQGRPEGTKGTQRGPAWFRGIKGTQRRRGGETQKKRIPRTEEKTRQESSRLRRRKENADMHGVEFWRRDFDRLGLGAGWGLVSAEGGFEKAVWAAIRWDGEVFRIAKGDVLTGLHR